MNRNLLKPIAGVTAAAALGLVAAEANIANAAPANRLDSYTVFVNNALRPAFMVTEYGNDAIVRFRGIRQVLRYCEGPDLVYVRTKINPNNQYQAESQKVITTPDAKVCYDGEITQKDYPHTKGGDGSVIVFWPRRKAEVFG